MNQNTADQNAKQQLMTSLLQQIENAKYELQQLHSAPRQRCDLALQTIAAEQSFGITQTDTLAQNLEIDVQTTQTPHLVEQERVQTEIWDSLEASTQTSYYDQFNVKYVPEGVDRRARLPPTLELDVRNVNGRDVFWCAGLALPKYDLSQRKQ